jgi:hypothetical protein
MIGRSLLIGRAHHLPPAAASPDEGEARLGVLQRSGAAEQIRIAPTLDEAVSQVDVIPPSTGSVTPVT